MAKIKYYYNTETCRYEKIKVTKTDIVLNLLGFLVVSLVAGVGIAFTYNHYVPSHSEVTLQKEKQQLLFQYNLLNKEMEQASSMLSALQDRDDKLYRAVFEAEPLPEQIRKGGVGGVDTYKELATTLSQNKELIIGTFKKLELLKKQMYIQTKSYDELMSLAKNKAQMMAALPAIQPLSKKHMIRFASSYGMRMHPIYKVRKMHTGVDLTAKTGAPIYATGDGVVERADWNGGYGNTVLLNHGYGYKTRYAHMSKIEVKVGEKVKRGMMVGRVGSTGTSVAPHLHYEVIHNDRHVNPVNYMFNDLTPEEYNELLKEAAQDHQSLGGSYDHRGYHRH